MLGQAVVIAARINDFETLDTLFFVESGFVKATNPTFLSFINNAFREATARKNLELATILLDKGADINITYKDNHVLKTAFVEAAAKGDMELVQFFLANGAEINHAYGRPRALEAAAENGHKEIFELLLKAAGDAHISYALISAAEEGHKEIVEILLSRLPEPKDKSTIDELSNALNSAAYYGHNEIIELLLDHGAQINHQKTGVSEALICAFHKHNKTTVELLLSRGANVNNVDFEGYTALSKAAEEGNMEIVQLLLDNGANVNEGSHGITPLERAAEAGHLEIIKLLLQYGANISDTNGNSQALISASKNLHKNVVEFLLDNGAHVNSRGSNEDKTPLSVAVMRDWEPETKYIYPEYLQAESVSVRRLETVQLLLSRGADVNAIIVDYSNNTTPLLEAISGDNIEIVQLLLDSRANINFTTIAGETPLERAAYYGDKDIIELLLSRGANINPINNQISPLLSACENEHTEIVEFLVTKGANINALNIHGSAPIIDLSLKRDKAKSIAILLRNGANFSNFDPNFLRHFLKLCPQESLDSILLNARLMWDNAAFNKLVASVIHPNVNRRPSVSAAMLLHVMNSPQNQTLNILLAAPIPNRESEENKKQLEQINALKKLRDLMQEEFTTSNDPNPKRSANIALIDFALNHRNYKLMEQKISKLLQPYENAALVFSKITQLRGIPIIERVTGYMANPARLNHQLEWEKDDLSNYHRDVLKRALARFSEKRSDELSAQSEEKAKQEAEEKKQWLEKINWPIIEEIKASSKAIGKRPHEISEEKIETVDIELDPNEHPSKKLKPTEEPQEVTTASTTETEQEIPPTSIAAKRKGTEEVQQLNDGNKKHHRDS
jgi:ankyrin repeat protein